VNLSHASRDGGPIGAEHELLGVENDDHVLLYGERS
jgi:hypothetical protein